MHRQGKVLTQLLTTALPGVTVASASEYNAVNKNHLEQIQNILANRVNEYRRYRAGDSGPARPEARAGGNSRGERPEPGHRN